MIQYCLTYMWLYHEAFQKEKLKKKFTEWHTQGGEPLRNQKTNQVLKISYKELSESYKTIVDSDEAKDGEIELKSTQLPEGEGMFEFKWRVFSEAEKENHDGHPAIELYADNSSLIWLKEYLFAGTEIKNKKLYNLSLFKLRITDYQFLNIVAVLEINETEELKRLREARTTIIRNINPLIKALEINLSILEENGYLIRTNDYFGIPEKLRGIIGLTYDDMYQYDEPAFLTGEHQNSIARVQEILKVEGGTETKIDDVSVYGIQNEPPVFVFSQEEHLLPEVICEYIEPMNLLLAERAASEDSVQVFYSIVDLAGEVNAINVLDKKVVTPVQRDRKQRFENFKAEDLRTIILKLAFVLDKCVVRRSSLEDWQPEYFEAYQNNINKSTLVAKAEMRERIGNYQELLSLHLDEKNQERMSKHSKTQETILGFFSFITFVGFVISVVDYLKEDKRDIWNISPHSFELQLFLSLSIFIFALAMYLYWYREFSLIKDNKNQKKKKRTK